MVRYRVLALGLCRAVTITFIAAGVACAPIRNTPQQDLAWQRWWDCRAQAPHANLLMIDPNGRIRFEFVAGFERDRIVACLRSHDAAGPVLPEPIAEGQRRGP